MIFPSCSCNYRWTQIYLIWAVASDHCHPIVGITDVMGFRALLFDPIFIYFPNSLNLVKAKHTWSSKFTSAFNAAAAASFASLFFVDSLCIESLFSLTPFWMMTPFNNTTLFLCAGDLAFSLLPMLWMLLPLVLHFKSSKAVAAPLLFFLGWPTGGVTDGEAAGEVALLPRSAAGLNLLPKLNISGNCMECP